MAGLAFVCWLTKYKHRGLPHDTDRDAPGSLRVRAREVVENGLRQQRLIVQTNYLKEDTSLYAANDKSRERWKRLALTDRAHIALVPSSPRYFNTIENIEVDQPALDVTE